MKTDREPLKSIRSARDERARSKYGRPSSKLWVLVGVGVIATLVVYRFISERQLDTSRDALLAQQRAAAATVGAEWYPLRDRLEKLAIDAAGPYAGDKVDIEAARWDFRSSPGIYLRMRVANAKDAKQLRKAAGDSVKDGFVACLLREPGSPAADAGPFAEQPWNMRQAYAATRVLSDEWVADVHEAGDPLRLRVFEQQYEKAKREEIPLAIEIVKRAQFFLLVLDEDADDSPEARATIASVTDGGPVTPEALQLVPHPARVVIVNLKTGAQIVRVRRVGAASFVFAGERAVADQDTRRAMQRQVNNCSLAQQVWAEVRPPVLDAGSE